MSDRKQTAELVVVAVLRPVDEEQAKEDPLDNDIEVCDERA